MDYLFKCPSLTDVAWESCCDPHLPLPAAELIRQTSLTYKSFVSDDTHSVSNKKNKVDNLKVGSPSK